MVPRMDGSASRSGRDPSPPSFLRLAGHPLRWRLLRELARSDRQVRELTALLGQPQSLVSYHLGRLLQGELVRMRRSAADRRDAYYSLDLAHCGELLIATGAALHPGLRLVQPAHAEDGPVPPSPRARVLFLCTGNSASSPRTRNASTGASPTRRATVTAPSRPTPPSSKPRRSWPRACASCSTTSSPDGPCPTAAGPAREAGTASSLWSTISPPRSSGSAPPDCPSGTRSSPVPAGHRSCSTTRPATPSSCSSRRPEPTCSLRPSPARAPRRAPSVGLDRLHGLRRAAEARATDPAPRSEHVEEPWPARVGGCTSAQDAGWNSSMGLPAGSSSRICDPPGPVTISFRKDSPAARSRSTSAARSSTTNSMRFQPPGLGRRPSGMGRPAELVGPLSSSRRLPRVTSAKAGAALERSVKPKWVV